MNKTNKKNKTNKTKKTKTNETDLFFDSIVDLITDKRFGHCNQDRAHHVFGFVSHLIIQFDGLKTYNELVKQTKKNK